MEVPRKYLPNLQTNGVTITQEQPIHEFERKFSDALTWFSVYLNEGSQSGKMIGGQILCFLLYLYEHHQILGAKGSTASVLGLASFLAKRYFIAECVLVGMLVLSLPKDLPFQLQNPLAITTLVSQGKSQSEQLKSEPQSISLSVLKDSDTLFEKKNGSLLLQANESLGGHF
ncbi:hypothetical protein Tco_0971083 [Tanacetum coccineum]